jgi:hypothetical protein
MGRKSSTRQEEKWRNQALRGFQKFKPVIPEGYLPAAKNGSCPRKVSWSQHNVDD